MPFPLEQEYPASRTWNEKPPPHARNPHQGAHVPPARAACACSMKAELGTQKLRKTNLERQNPHTRAQPHPGAHVPPARAACACSMKAELGTQKLRKTNLERQNPHTRTQSPPRRTRAPSTCCVRLLHESRTQNAGTPQAELRTKILRKPNSERKYSASRTWNEKNASTRATPPGRTRAPGTCCVRLLQQSRT